MNHLHQVKTICLIHVFLIADKNIKVQIILEYFEKKELLLEKQQM